jgi:hypothetical protein
MWTSSWLTESWPPAAAQPLWKLLVAKASQRLHSGRNGSSSGTDPGQRASGAPACQGNGTQLGSGATCWCAYYASCNMLALTRRLVYVYMKLYGTGSGQVFDFGLDSQQRSGVGCEHA